MPITLADVITWLVVGGLAGTLMGKMTRGKKGGLARLANLGVGLVGALIGGLLFAVVPMARPLAAISVNLEDIVAALVGSVIFLLLLRLLKQKKGANQAVTA